MQRREHLQPVTPSRTVSPMPRTRTPPPRPTPTPPPPPVNTPPRTIPPPPRMHPPSPRPTPPPVNTPPRTVLPPPRTQTLSPRPTQTPSPTLINSIGMKFVRIEAGTFWIGSDTWDNEKPMHQVRISKAFYLGAYEVTQGQWQRIMGTNPSRFTDDPNLPVGNVTGTTRRSLSVNSMLKRAEQRIGCQRKRSGNMPPGRGRRQPTVSAMTHAS